MPAALEILIVDDDELLCQRLEALLAAHRLSAISVHSLALAREAMRAIYFPLVILDRRLEDGDGSELCREYRARQSDKRVRILMLSNSDSAEEEAFAMSSGADAFLSKKCSDEVLAARVMQLHAIACGRKVKNVDSTAEQSRLRALRDSGVLSGEPDRAYDDIIRLARAIFRTPIAHISFVDAHCVWIRSERGLAASKVAREYTLCSRAIERPNELLVVPDASSDARFAKLPFVADEPHIRFYAGAPLVTSDGHAVGTICIIDTIPRTLDAEATECLRALARQVVFLLEQRRHKRELEQTLIAQRAADADLRRSEALFREAFESAPIGKALVSVSGQWLRVNRWVCDLLGYTEAELLATTFQAITHPDDLETDLGHVRDMLDGKIRSYEMEKRYVHKRGHLVWAMLSVSLVRDDADRPLFFVSQIQDITARKHLEHAKGEFLAMVSHELRTPVTAVRGALGLLTAGVGGVLPAKAQDLAQLAHRNTDKLQRLIDDILDVEKIESGTFRYERSLFDLDDFIVRCAEDMRPYAEQYGVRIVTTTPPVNLRLLADQHRIGQVLANLLSNAVKFSPSGSDVEIAVVRQTATVRIDVIDRGPGIPADYRPLIFQKYVQADNGKTSKAGGTGLGLSISKAIIDAHRGAIAFETTPHGTTFYFELPTL